MAKTGYYRWEVWKANFSEFGIDEHFVVIVSNFKNNTKNVNVQVCLITSKLKEYSNRVNIDLLVKSQIKCDTILTLSKSKLLFRECKIEDIFIQLEVEKQLQIQMQLSSNFINNDIEQVENYLTEGVSKMINESDLSNLKNAICDLALENKYQETIIMCNKLIELTQASNLECKTKFLWHSYYHRSLMFSKLERYQISLEDARESLKYVPSLRDGMNNLYSYSNWLIAKNLENLNDIDGAKRIYSNLCSYYKKIGKTSMRITMLYNICIINKDISKMQILINILEKTNYRELETEKNKNELIMQMREDLKQLTQ